MSLPRIEGLRRRLSYANIIATLALFVALGGTSVAAVSYINGRQIRPHSIPKNRLTHRAITQLKANRGPRGLRGARGPAGPVGPTGPGPVVLAYAGSGTRPLPAGKESVAVAMCPPGMVVTGGGGITAGSPSFTNTGVNISASAWASSREGGPPDEWWVAANNASASDTTFSATATCARATVAGSHRFGVAP
jgi:hypothetical protein